MIVASPSVNVKSYNSSSVALASTASKKDKSSLAVGGSAALAASAAAAAASKTRKRKSRDEIYVDPKETEAASTAAKVLEEAFHQLCEMCGHYFQVIGLFSWAFGFKT